MGYFQTKMAENRRSQLSFNICRDLHRCYIEYYYLPHWDELNYIVYD